MKFKLNKYYNMDCMELMRLLPDKYFDLAIADPPYFSGPDTRKYYGNIVSGVGVARKEYPVLEHWDIPESEYFDELMRISKHQIIWGVNYYDYSFGSGRIVWDKVNEGTSFSDCELAYCSIHDSVRKFTFMWNGMMQGLSETQGHIQQGNKRLNEKRIHQCQKPVALYRWICSKYAKEGDKIFDPNVGSASSLIAFHELGLDFIGTELDKDMYMKSSERLEAFKSQMSLW